MGQEPKAEHAEQAKALRETIRVIAAAWWHPLDLQKKARLMAQGFSLDPLYLALSRAEGVSSVSREGVSVAGRLARSLADFERACLVTIAEMQRHPSPDNATIALLCDAVRLSREYPVPAVPLSVPEQGAQRAPVRTNLDIALDAIDDLLVKYHAHGLVLYPAHSTLLELTRQFRKMQKEETGG